jgi:hypothetical protein
VNIFSSTGGRVDASPEHLRPGFDGGTGVRTVGPLVYIVGIQRYRSGIQGPIPSSTQGRGRYLFKARHVFQRRERE